jgi:hypothetical protein
MVNDEGIFLLLGAGCFNARARWQIPRYSEPDIAHKF